ALFIFAPLIQYFPVGLGLKMLVLSSVFTVLLFGLLLPVFAYYKRKQILSIAFIAVSLFFIIQTHSTNKFTPERQKPNSLLYYADEDEGKAYWLTYDKTLDDWTKSILGKKPKQATDLIDVQPYSKYGRAFTYAADAEHKNIPSIEVALSADTIVAQNREVEFTIILNRRVNRLEIHSDNNKNFHILDFNRIMVHLFYNSY